VSDGLLSIGAFSRATGISVNTLRQYHELGVLVPARIDRQSGYRSYSVDQLADAFVVMRLRGLDVPLAQVKEIVDAHDPEVTRRVLEQHQRAMQDRLADTERIISELQHGLAPSTNTPVHVRHDDAQHTVRIAADVPGEEIWSWLSRAYPRLDDAIRAGGGLVAGPSAALYRAQIDSDEFERVEAFFPVAAPFVIPRGFSEVTIGEVPERTSAVLVHRGSYEQIGDTYRALGAWVARNAEPSGADVCERYMVSPDDTDDPDQYRTEIAWPISAVDR
jgi:DNA-binding transcriptional MerR regulator/effector-binding domain-containing protein